MAYYKCGRIYTTQNSNVVVDTASGAIANFNTPLALPLLKTKFDVNAVQDLHGQSGPYPAGGGKNLININGIVNAEQKNPTDVVTLANGMVIKGMARNGYLRPTNVTTIVDGNSITVTSTNDVYGVGYVFACKEGQDYCFSSATANTRNACVFYGSNGVFISGSGFNTGTQVYTAPENAVYGIIIVYSSAVDTPTTCIKPQLEKGSTATSWAPYENICPIEGMNEINAFHCHKNLYQYDESKVKTGTTTSSTTRAYIPLGVKGSGDFTFKATLKSGQEPTIHYINIGKIKDGIITVLQSFIQGANLFDRTVSYNEGDEIVLVSASESIYSVTSSLPKYDIQIEVGSQTTSYEPYNGSTAVIQLGDTYYGGYLTQDKNGKREITVTHKRYVLDSTLQERNISVGVLSGYTQVSYLPYIDEGVNGAVFACDTFEYQSSNVTHTPYKVWSSAAAPRLFFGLETTITTRAEALSWFSDNPTIVIAPIADPYTIDLPDGTPIKSFAGINNIFCDTGDTSLQFRKIG